ncbi:MAG: chemotaxis protein CheB, partial [Myxococcota bacterium]
MNIAVVSGSPANLRLLQDGIRSGGRHRCIWRTEDLEDVAGMVGATPPDLLMVDLRTGGKVLETIGRVVRLLKCPVVVVTDNISANSSVIFDAMGNGALDTVLLPDPLIPASCESFNNKLSAVELLLNASRTEPQNGLRPQGVKRTKPHIIALGASTGGPQALATIMAGFPASLRSAVVVVQHVDRLLAPNLASWLKTQVPFPVNLAAVGDEPKTGHVLIAGTNDHLILTPQLCFDYTRHPEDCPYRPSVDALFASLAAYWPEPGSAALLTGMGRDGA